MRKITSVLCLFLLVGLLIGCSAPMPSAFSDSTPRPPVPVLSVDGQPVPYQLGTYSWASNGRGVAVDSVDPPTLVEPLVPVTVGPNAVLNVTFTDAPEEVGIAVWTGDGADFEPVTGGQAVLPSEEGDYVFVLWASWPQGDATYAFPVRVTK